MLGKVGCKRVQWRASDGGKGIWGVDVGRGGATAIEEGGCVSGVVIAMMREGAS